MFLITVYLLKTFCACEYSPKEISSIITLHYDRYNQFLYSNETAIKIIKKINRLDMKIYENITKIESLKKGYNYRIKELQNQNYSEISIRNACEEYLFRIKRLQRKNMKKAKKIHEKNRYLNLVFCKSIKKTK